MSITYFIQVDLIDCGSPEWEDGEEGEVYATEASKGILYKINRGLAKAKKEYPKGIFDILLEPISEEVQQLGKEPILDEIKRELKIGLSIKSDLKRVVEEYLDQKISDKSLRIELRRTDVER